MEETWQEYELLTRDVVSNLLRISPDSRLEHDVVVQGLGTKHQVDVLWDVPEKFGGPCTAVFECKEYSRNVAQEKLMAFKAKIEDIAALRGPAYGVFVVSSGYQSGARNYASTYGIVILELRAPKPRDLEGRITQIDLTFHFQIPKVTDWKVSASHPTREGTIRVATDQQLILADGQVTTLRDVVTKGILDGFGAVPPTRVTREFLEPATLAGTDVLIQAVSATVQAEDLLETRQVGGAERISLVLNATIPGASAFIMDNGRMMGDVAQMLALIRPGDML